MAMERFTLEVPAVPTFKPLGGGIKNFVVCKDPEAYRGLYATLFESVNNMKRLLVQFACTEADVQLVQTLKSQADDLYEKTQELLEKGELEGYEGDTTYLVSSLSDYALIMSGTSTRLITKAQKQENPDEAMRGWQRATEKDVDIAINRFLKLAEMFVKLKTGEANMALTHRAHQYGDTMKKLEEERKQKKELKKQLEDERRKREEEEQLRMRAEKSSQSSGAIANHAAEKEMVAAIRQEIAELRQGIGQSRPKHGGIAFNIGLPKEVSCIIQ